MPGGDRTGPMGQGPMTGRGMGFCAGNNAPGYVTGGGFGRGGGRGMGGGFGRGFGRGRGGGGRGWRNGFWATGLPGWARWGYGMPGSWPNAGPVAQPGMAAGSMDEKAFLEAQLSALEQEVTAIRSRLDELADNDAG